MVAAGSLGRIVLAKFSRLSSMSRRWGDNWFHHTELSGGALLDLHIHDVDFLASLWGLPPAVSSVAANRLSTGDKVDYVLTEYLYPDFACVAEGGWAMAPGFPFQMAYQVLGEQGLLDFSSLRDPALMFYPVDGEKHALEVEPGSAYDRELAYFFNCIATNQAPTRVTPEDALQAVRICLAERESGMTRKPVAL
jgi:predicted dehydrogenase